MQKLQQMEEDLSLKDVCALVRTAIYAGCKTLDAVKQYCYKSNEALRYTPEFVGQVHVAWMKETKAHEMEMILRKIGLQPPEEVD